MPQYATVTGHVTYMPGDGTPIKIPKGRIEVELAPDSAILSWEQADGVVGSAAIPRSQYDEYVEQGKIEA
ncbi:hypothetical protein GT347_21040 [Xylophilus rhododendri]|uniref:Uncharacterized protein n=1 Tax=Xylophilus rhododendri TaxID=2697032 RepID=A0A857J941_9BURK|nr:hypothetical protein [Xylophilus rhododendri]QHJ00248.1 hypothetical protein GT347_21040 [Xylophilus rhododendri]